VQARQPVQQSGDVVDLRSYVEVLRRRVLVIIVLGALGLGLALGYSKLQTPIYTATAEVLLNPPPGSAGQNLSNVISVDTEAQVVKSAPIATAAAAALDSPLTTQLLKHVSVNTTSGSFVLGIGFWDANPTQAAQGANAFAKAYLDYKRKQSQDQIDQQEASIENQIAELEQEQSKQNRILDSSAPGTIEYRNAQDALSQLSIKLAVLASSLAQLPQIVNPGQIILPAVPPKSPSSPNIKLNTAIGLLLGLLSGVVAVFALDRMDDRVRRGADVQLYLDAPLLASVPRVKGRDRHRAKQLVVHLEPRSPVAEAYRTIRTSVMSMAHKRHLQVFAFASAVQGEGKSITCANVAAALGQTDKRVLVLSADIRRPKIHEFFFASNEPGLSEVLEGEFSFGDAVVRTEVGNVWVLPGGHFPARPAELLQSPAMAELLKEARREFDFVIVDCPPVLGLADCLAVLPLVDAVLLVVQADKTHGSAIFEVSDRLERVGVSVDAAILNDVKVRRGRPGHHAYGYYLASNDYLRPQETTSPTRRQPARPPASSTLDSDEVVTDVEEPQLEPSPRPGSQSAAGSSSTSNGETPVSAIPEPSTSSADQT
jgi:capsular exopolysaccharide synthesis family protein